VNAAHMNLLRAAFAASIVLVAAVAAAREAR
jgi:hypothetical protein